jgi:hypothetical protein
MGPPFRQLLVVSQPCVDARVNLVLTVWTEAGGQIAPWRRRSQDPEDAIDSLFLIFCWPRCSRVGPVTSLLIALARLLPDRAWREGAVSAVIWPFCPIMLRIADPAGMYTRALAPVR